MELRGYQSCAIQGARTCIANGQRHVLIVAPTGAGKTSLASAIVKGHMDRGGIVAWVAHRRELIKQAASTLHKLGVDCGHLGERPDAKCQVVSVQAMLASGKAPEATLVVLDEAHHYVSEEWSRIASAYKSSGAILIGLTATPERADGQGLGEIFSGLVVAAQIKDLTDRGYLVPCDIVAPTRDVRGNHIAQSPVDAYRAHGNGKPCLVFAPHVQAAEEFAGEFRMAGIRVGIVHGALAMDERDATLEAFDRGEVDVLVNVMVLTEGYDSPRAEVCIIARRIGSASLYLQMVGRVLRPFAGKERATLIDLTGVVNIHGAPDEERIFSLDGKAVRRKGEAPEGTVCPTCGAPYNGGPPCVQCGYAGKEMLTPDVQGVPLDKFAWAAELSGDRRVNMLANWYRAAHEKGHKLKSADYKYRAVFKHWPSAALVAQAKERIGA